ncbi:MAG TPA: ABC transporter substrate-binding protein [Acidimicrobiales bacterium]|nr:ABC transporter substrate-binding protein [Acidimicrobiales bacterium]
MRKVRVVVVLVVMVLVAAACGSSSKKGASAGGSTTASSAGKATGSTINVGVIGSLTGPQASSSDQFGTVAPAWADYVNQQLGGINGHPVKVFVQDDGNDPAKAQAAEKTLVDSDNVVAIVVGSDNLVTAFDGDAIGKGVAVISGTANSTDWYSKAGMYPTVTDVLSGLSGQLLVAKQFAKATKFADLYCAEIAACQQADPPLKAAATKAGVGFTSLAVSSTAPSYTAQCVQLQQQKVDYAQLNFASAAAAKFMQDCQAQGYNPTWGSSAQAIGKDLLGVSNVTVYGPAYAFPSVASAAPAQTFVSAMTKYAKDSNWREGTASFTWSGLEVLRKALANAGATPTRQDVTSGLNSFNGEDLGGLLANKLTFSAGKTIPFGGHPCMFVIGIKNGKTIAPANLTPSCVS